MTDKAVNTAIVGFGRWGQLLYTASQSAPALNVTRVVTRSPHKVSDFCGNRGLLLSDNLPEALEDPDIEAVIIATPHSQHYEQLLAVASAGKHVYCEKPFTLQAKQAETALGALRNGGCKVAIGHNRRFAPNTQALKALLDESKLGRVYHIDGLFHVDMSGAKGQWRDSDVESPAGGMTSLGIHIVDMFIHLMGPIRNLSASSHRITKQCHFDDHTSASVVFENGARGQLTTLTATPMRWQISVYGDQGWAELREQDTLVWQSKTGEQQVTHYPGYGYPATATITAALGAFANDVLGIAPFPITTDQITHGTAVLEGIIQSALHGESVEV